MVFCEEPKEHIHGHGLNLLPQSLDCQPMNPRQQPAMTPLDFIVFVGVFEATAQHQPFAFQSFQRCGGLARCQRKQLRDVRSGHWSANFQQPANCGHSSLRR